MVLGKVECFSIAGLDIYFRSLDHDPPHIHVLRRGEWEIRVRFLTCTETFLDYEMKWPPLIDRGPGAGDRKAIRAAVLEYQLQLLEEWTRKVKVS